MNMTNSLNQGPAIILDRTQTILIFPGASATALSSKIVIRVGSAAPRSTRVDVVDPIQLSIFGHRFMSIAEQMGRTLQKTSVSLNIKERLDFSCAIFGPDGGLVANAPHVPVHLGSMQHAVKYQHELNSGKLKSGDVLLSNSPSKSPIAPAVQNSSTSTFLTQALQRPEALICQI